MTAAMNAFCAHLSNEVFTTLGLSHIVSYHMIKRTVFPVLSCPCYLSDMWVKEEKIFTHAGHDAVHREVGLFAALTTFLSLGFEDGVLLLGDVDIEARVCGAHDELGARVESNAFACGLLDTDQTHTIPKNADDMV